MGKLSKPEYKRCDGADLPPIDNRCQRCGAKYHCHICGTGVAMYGHYVEPSKHSGLKGFYTCERPDLYEQWLDFRKNEKRTRDLNQLRDLMELYRHEAKTIVKRWD